MERCGDMASQEQVRATFNGMNLEQKSQFIESLRKSVKAINSVENKQLLDECMALYKKELGVIAKRKVSVITRPLDNKNKVARSVNDSKSIPSLEPGEESAEVLYSNPLMPTANKNKIGNIDMRISEIYDKIQRNMSLIETISYILYEMDNYPYEVFTQESKTEPALSPEIVGDYEKKIQFVEEKITEIANSVRHDMNVIKEISDLLYGEHHT